MTNSSQGGISLMGVLLVIFVVLKLTGNIAWSWWWVLSPLWIGAAVVLVVVLILIIFAAIAATTL